MTFREVRVIEVREVLRAWLGGAGLRSAAERAGVDRKTARRYAAAAEVAGLVRAGGEAQLTDELIGAVVAAVRPARAAGHGVAWERLEPWTEQITSWLRADLQLTNIHAKLAGRGVVVPYRTLHRFAAGRCGFGARQPTVRVADGRPGVECQLDFGRLGRGRRPPRPVLGPVGVGKTHLATALGHIAIRRRRTVAFSRADQLLRRLKAARLDNSVEAEMRRLARVELLILDDFALQAMDPVETADFYELVVERHHKTSTVITSNRDPAEWISMMSDALLAQSAVDRLVATSYELLIEGESYRRRQRPTTARRP